MKILLVVFSFILYACEEIFEDFNVKEYKSNIVIEGIITDQDPPYYVKVMETVSFGDSIREKYISGAEVIISDNEGKKEILLMEKEGIYRCDSIKGKLGNTYRLEVRVGNSIFTSQCKIAPLVIVDSVIYYFREKAGMYNEGYYIHFFGRKPQTDSVNYYKYNFYRNGHLITNRIYSNLISDASSSIEQEFDFEEIFKLNDTADLEIFSLTEENFEYFLDVNELVASDYYVFGYHRNPESNISNGALGYFLASACKKIRIIIK